MVSAKRVMCGALIFVMAAYLFYGFNHSFSVGIFASGSSTLWYYLRFAMLGTLIVAAYLIYKDSLLGGILAVCCTGFLIFLIIRNLAAAWIPGMPYADYIVIRHIHTVVRETLIPGLMLLFGIMAMAAGKED